MAETHTSDRRLEERHGERKHTIDNYVLHGIDLRTRAYMADAAGPTERYVKHALRPPLSDGTGSVRNVVLLQGHPLPDQMQVLDYGGGESSMEGGTVLPWPAVADEVQNPRQAKPRQLPPSRHQSTRPLHQLRPWPSTSLVHLARITAGQADGATIPVYVKPELRRKPSGASFTTPPWTSAPLGGEAVATSRNGYVSGGRAIADHGSWRLQDDLSHHRGSPFQPRWVSDTELANSRYATRGGSTAVAGGDSWRTQHGRPHHRGSRLQRRWGSDPEPEPHEPWTEGNWEGEHPGASSSAWRSQPADDQPFHKCRSPSTPTSTDRTMAGDRDGSVAGMANLLAPGSSANTDGGHNPGGTIPRAAKGTLRPTSRDEQYRNADSLASAAASPQLQGAGGHGMVGLSPPVEEEGGAARVDSPVPVLGGRNLHGHPLTAADRCVATTGITPTSSGGFRVGQSSGEEGGPKPEEDDGVSFPRGPGRTPGEDGSSGGARTYTTDLDHGLQLYHDHRSLGGSPVPGRYHSQSFQLPDHRQQQLVSMFPTVSTAVTRPWLGRGNANPDSHVTALRPLALGFTDLERRTSPLPGLAEAVATLGSQAVSGRGRLASGFLHGGSSHRHGSGDTAATHARQSEPTRAKSSTCMKQGCERRSTFVYKESNSLAYCATHRLAGMVDKRHPYCEEIQCSKQASFGMEGDRRPSFCSTHKKAKMINVTSRRCSQPLCLRHPNFGLPGDLRPSYCKEHRYKGMVDIVSRRCRDPTCTRRPVYNTMGLRPVFCSKHKVPGMIDVVSARCQELGCLRHPSFGYASDMKARRCVKHRLANMEGVKKRRRLKIRLENATTVAAAATTTTSCPA